MRHGEYSEESFHDHTDSLPYMKLRRIINGEYAEEPVDFNVAGIEAGQKVIHRSFTDEDVIADIGCSSGEMIAEAALQTGISAKVVGIEPDEEALYTHQLLNPELQKRILLVQASGEAVPLKDDSVIGASLHNVIFRVNDSVSMLHELRRIVKPGGFIAISSNARDHAYYRHLFESQVAEKVMEFENIELTVPAPPAEGHYLENLPDLVKKIGGLTIMDDLYISQETHAVITRGSRLDNYIDSIKYSAANTDLPAQHMSTWRKVVDLWVRNYVEAQIQTAEEVIAEADINAVPHFADPIRRGMFVLRNDK